MDYDRRTASPVLEPQLPDNGPTSAFIDDPLLNMTGMYGNGFMMDLVAGAGTDGGMCLAPGEQDPNAIAASTEQPPAQEEEGGLGVMDLVHGGLDLAGLVPGWGEPIDGINALLYALEGDDRNSLLSMGAMVPFLGWGATTGKLGMKGAKALRGAEEARAAARAAEELTPRAARRKAMREAGIPTSQQPVAQQSARLHPGAPPAGRQYTYEMGGETYSVQHSLTDDVPGHGPHWEAGPVKVDDKGVPIPDSVGRPRLYNGKVKVEE